ncbi:uncharacterized protein LOC133525987 [Cydia pomonella]|uniref:uncharacterized protein LOC133525987 n=1 Tax=Cydia pomonella TaxID=82600 RepID=UPI002ADDCD25|nr:uncharacterized protein LOC133525987 [Cydia pomonella]
MELLHITLIAILIVFLCGVRGDGTVPLPKLERNTLATLGDRGYRDSRRLDCGLWNIELHEFRSSGHVYDPSTVLTTSNFGKYPYDNIAMNRQHGALVNGGQGKFSFAELKHTDSQTKKVLTVYALQVDGTGSYAYWLPQGRSIDIPARPKHGDAKFVFTPNFGGCSWTVTPTRYGKLRLRHVTGNNETYEFNNLDVNQKGGATTYALQYKDYGYIKEGNQYVENSHAYAYMHYNNGWKLHVQQKTCTPNGSPSLSDVPQYGKIQKLKFNYPTETVLQTRYNQITKTTVYRIPIP